MNDFYKDLGPIPQTLDFHHYEFLKRVKMAVEMLSGIQNVSYPTTPRTIAEINNSYSSQAVIHEDLEVLKLNNQGVLSLLASAIVNLQDGDSKSVIYTVPSDMSLVPIFVIIRNPTASLAGGSDFNLGDGEDADTWVNAVDLSSMTGTSDYYIIDGNNTKYSIFESGIEFGIKPVTGATADAEATAELFGYLIAS